MYSVLDAITVELYHGIQLGGQLGDEGEGRCLAPNARHFPPSPPKGRRCLEPGPDYWPTDNLPKWPPALALVGEPWTVVCSHNFIDCVAYCNCERSEIVVRGLRVLSLW